MPLHRRLMAILALGAAFVGPAQAANFDLYGAAPAELAPIQPESDVIVILGLGVGTAAAYEGASDYTMTFKPIIKVEKLQWGWIDIDGEKRPGGFKFSPSAGYEGERRSEDHAALTGFDDVGATYALGARIGYEFVFDDTLSAEIYGAARYAFGGARGWVGEAGVDITAKLTPELEIVGGPVVNFASEGYMDSYFGVTPTESAASGGRVEAFDPSGGIKSVGVKLEARYEFVPDTFVSLNASYSSYVGDISQSPVVKAGSEQQFTVGLGLARRFSF
ncbi:MipA/OmpV family protein [Devosia sp. ZW T5_3]|uniref:MipA/OmpV family protein n=1 Tax=Devosia sp. ZW T5_3 TaxID=3378085 RepID=UPI003853D1AD